MAWRTYEHPTLDLFIDVDGGDGRACLRFGATLDSDDIPVDGEVIKAGGKLYSVGLMDTSEPPLLHSVTEEPECGLWWDADDSEPNGDRPSVCEWCDRPAIGTDSVSDRCACAFHLNELIGEATDRAWQSGNRYAGESTPECIQPVKGRETEFGEALRGKAKGTYHVSMDDGLGGEETIEAATLADAVKWAKDWAECAEWPHGKRNEHTVTVTNADDESESESFTI